MVILTSIALEHTDLLGETEEEVAAEKLAVVRAGGAPLVVGRELTKQFEEIVEGTAAGLAERFAQGTARGEFTLVLAAARSGPPAP